MIDNKVILITGGTGTFGYMFVEYVLENLNPKKLIIYSRDEFKQQEMKRHFNDKRLRFFIGDVRDKKRLDRAVTNVDIIIHAAALKHVDVCEYNPHEAIKTNIQGAQNVIDAAIDNGFTEKVINLSTDKAVNPINLYGATKLAAEKLFSQAIVYTTGKCPRFASVRYGNVIGSRGSVHNLFMEQAKAGKRLTITNEYMTRFFISKENAIKTVLDTLEFMKGGEVVVPLLTSEHIVTVANLINKEFHNTTALEVIGKRPGEKIHERLITKAEVEYTYMKAGYYIIFNEHNKKYIQEYGKSIKIAPADLDYTSKNYTETTRSVCYVCGAEIGEGAGYCYACSMYL